MKGKQTHFKGVVISDPCHEDWHRMDAHEKGRFCNQCSRIVYDFTKDTDPTEFFKIYRDTKGEMCGNFYEKSPGYFGLLKLRTQVLLTKSKVAAVSLVLGWGLLNFKGAKAQQQGDSVKIENIAPVADSLGFVMVNFIIKEKGHGYPISENCSFKLEFKTYSVSIPIVSGGQITVKIPKEYINTKGFLTVKAKGYRKYKKKRLIVSANENEIVLSETLWEKNKWFFEDNTVRGRLGGFSRKCDAFY